MKYGTQAKLAKKLSWGPFGRQTINALLSEKKIKNLSPGKAKQIAAITNSDPFIWMIGGDVDARKEALKKWAAMLE